MSCCMSLFHRSNPNEGVCGSTRAGETEVRSRQSEQAPLDRQTSAFYRDALVKLGESHVPFLIGGAYACTHYTGIPHYNKDLDIVVRPQDCTRALQIAFFGRLSNRTYLSPLAWQSVLRRGLHRRHVQLG